MCFLDVKVFEDDFNDLVFARHKCVEQAIECGGVVLGVIWTTEGAVLLAVCRRIQQTFTP